MGVIELVPFKEPCVEVSKMRAAGKFDRWCCKHHHWLNEAPPQRTVSEELASSALKSDSTRGVPFS
jgi:hypothetical protein